MSKLDYNQKQPIISCFVNSGCFYTTLWNVFYTTLPQGWQILRKQYIEASDVNVNSLVTTKDYCMTGRANPIFCAVGLR